jgi:hypothetical protein
MKGGLVVAIMLCKIRCACFLLHRTLVFIVDVEHYM